MELKGLKAGNHDFRRRKEGDSGLYNKIQD